MFRRHYTTCDGGTKKKIVFVRGIFKIGENWPRTPSFLSHTATLTSA
jgi:hypothetical protein